MKGFHPNHDYEEDQYYEGNPLHITEEEGVLRMPVKNHIKRLEVRVK